MRQEAPIGRTKGSRSTVGTSLGMKRPFRITLDAALWKGVQSEVVGLDMRQEALRRGDERGVHEGMHGRSKRVCQAEPTQY